MHELLSSMLQTAESFSIWSSAGRMRVHTLWIHSKRMCMLADGRMSSPDSVSMLQCECHHKGGCSLRSDQKLETSCCAGHVAAAGGPPVAALLKAQAVPRLLAMLQPQPIAVR